MENTHCTPTPFTCIPSTRFSFWLALQHTYFMKLYHLSLPFLISQPGVKLVLRIYCKGQRNLCGPHLYNSVRLAWSFAHSRVPHNDERTASGKVLCYVLWVSSPTQAQVDAESFRRCSPLISSAGEQMLMSLNWMQIYFKYLHDGIQNH